ncbi:hypothetical protein [uncultured Paraglaciecola sp.]|uniref:hypothetical protein n=1 Tax=uncultured Paraglaciecola sp. TaxID=1765024 RepID=UPI002633F6FF|nr:hypothetical protein [uncultured Paraglaciecola sp.]
MAGAFVDGALKGFEMMDRHLARKDNKARLADLDKRNEQRYQDGLDRQAQLDKERKNNREQDVAYRDQQAADTKAYREQTREDTSNYRQWQQNYQTQQANWKNDQPAIAMAWQTYRDTGTIPKDLEPVMQRNKAMDPRTYAKPEARENIKMFDSLLGEVAKTGKVSELNSPKSIELTNAAFSDKLNSTVGQYNENVKSKVASNKIVNYVPLSEKGEPPRFGFEIEVTYENGMKEIKPMTKGRTSEPDDPVMTYTPKELFGTVKTRAMMADMIERPEYWDKMGTEVAANFGRRSAQQKEAPQESEYRKERAKILKDEADALAEIEYSYGAPKKDSPDEAKKKRLIEAVRAQFKQREDKLGEIYGKQVAEAPPKEGSGNKGYADFSDDELMSFIYGSSGEK